MTDHDHDHDDDWGGDDPTPYTPPLRLEFTLGRVKLRIPPVILKTLSDAAGDKRAAERCEEVRKALAQPVAEMGKLVDAVAAAVRGALARITALEQKDAPPPDAGGPDDPFA